MAIKQRWGGPDCLCNCTFPKWSRHVTHVADAQRTTSAGGQHLIEDASMLGVPGEDLTDCSPWHFVPADESPRTYDTWGMGWMKFHSILATQVADADKVVQPFGISTCTSQDISRWLQTSSCYLVQLRDG